MSELMKRFEELKRIKEWKNNPKYDSSVEPDFEKIPEGGKIILDNPTPNGGDSIDRDIKNSDVAWPEEFESEVFFDNDSFVEDFFCKYENVEDERLKTIKQHLINVIEDIKYIEESNQTNEQWALDYLDALNELSSKF